MKFTLLFSILCLPFVMASCGKKEITPVDSCGLETDATLLWSSPINGDTAACFLQELVMGKKYAFLAVDNGIMEKRIQARDIETGKIVWEWGDPEIGEDYNVSKIVAWEDYLVVDKFGRIFVLDQNTGTLLWKSTQAPPGEKRTPRTTIIDGMIYFKTQDKPDPYEEYAKLWRTPITHFAPELIFQVDRVTTPGRDSGYLMSIEFGALWTHPSGDSILVFQTRGFRLGTSRNRTDLYAYNLNTKALHWKIDSIDAKSTVHNPIVVGDDLYYQGEDRVFNIDMNNGNIKWSHRFDRYDEHLFTSEINVGNSYIYIQPGADYFYALDRYTGNVAWRTEPLSCCGSGKGPLPLIGDNFYFVASPNLVSVSSVKNKINWACPTPFLSFDPKESRFEQSNSTVKVPDKKVIVTCDTYFMMAFEIK